MKSPVELNSLLSSTKQSGKEKILFYLNFFVVFIYSFVFPGAVTMFYVKFTFDGEQYKLWSIKFEAFNSYTVELKKRKTALLNQS